MFRAVKFNTVPAPSTLRLEASLRPNMGASTGDDE